MYSAVVRTTGVGFATLTDLLYTGLIMSPLGIQRTIAALILISPWVFIPGIFKDIVFIIAGILLFISTLDLRKRVRVQDPHEESTQASSQTA